MSQEKVFNPEYFPEEIIGLNEEIIHHPDLMQVLAAQPNKDVYILIAEVALFCGIFLDGTYTRQDILNICTVCHQFLRARRFTIVIPPTIH